MRNYQKHYSTRKTSQRKPIPGKEHKMGLMESQGYGFKVDKWTMLDRFLILGTDGGTYYVGEADLTKQNLDAVLACIKEEGPRVVKRVCEISEGGLAPKNDPALFVLAMCTALGDEYTRRTAFLHLSDVARIGTHLFQFCAYRESFAGWGRGMRQAVKDWYVRKRDRLAYQILKYKQRDGWSHRDLLRLAHPRPATNLQSALYAYIVKGSRDEVDPMYQGFLPPQVHAVEDLKLAANEGTLTENQVIEAIIKERLTREMIPTEYLDSAAVQAALLHDMPLGAMIRNLGNLTRSGLLVPLGEETRFVVESITNEEALKAARIHPFAVLVALNTYRKGRGIRGKGEWTPVGEIVNALERAFYLTFQNVEPSGKRILIAQDYSGSMGGSYSGINGVPGMSPAFGATAMSLITFATEPNVAGVAFATSLKEITLHKGMTLEEARRICDDSVGEGTDCTVPIQYLMGKPLKSGWSYRGKSFPGTGKLLDVDAIVMYTDSQSWAGERHLNQWLDDYRRAVGHPVKFVVVQMAANQWSQGDADDPDTLNVVGFDTSCPKLISDFIAGRF